MCVYTYAYAYLLVMVPIMFPLLNGLPICVKIFMHVFTDANKMHVTSRAKPYVY